VADQPICPGFGPSNYSIAFESVQELFAHAQQPMHRECSENSEREIGMELPARIPSVQRHELDRLCKLYDSAIDRADLPVARDIRGAISDSIGKLCKGDAEFEAELKKLLGFPVDPTAIALDQ
jgi:hypothetical protein